MMNKCCIKGCQSSYYTAVSKENEKSVFKVPEDVSISILWKMFVMIESLRVEQFYSFALIIAKITISECLYKRFICTTHILVCWRWLTFPSQALETASMYIDVYTSTGGGQHACARCAAHLYLHTRRYIYISFTAAYAFFPTPTTTRWTS